MGRIRLTESELTRIVKRTIKEMEGEKFRLDDSLVIPLTRLYTLQTKEEGGVYTKEGRSQFIDDLIEEFKNSIDPFDDMDPSESSELINDKIREYLMDRNEHYPLFK